MPSCLLSPFLGVGVWFTPALEMSSTTSLATAEATATATVFKPTNPFETDAGAVRYTVFGLNIALIALSTLFVYTRLYMRTFMVKAYRLDDIIAFLAWAICHVVASARVYR
jgi:prolipoprotein diacylglyceryltransferase